MLTRERVVWEFLNLTDEERTAAVCKMLDDGRLKLGPKLAIEPGPWFAKLKTDIVVASECMPAMAMSENEPT